jgi:hypothetical protein
MTATNGRIVVDLRLVPAREDTEAPAPALVKRKPPPSVDRRKGPRRYDDAEVARIANEARRSGKPLEALVHCDVSRAMASQLVRRARQPGHYIPRVGRSNAGAKPIIAAVPDPEPDDEEPPHPSRAPQINGKHAARDAPTRRYRGADTDVVAAAVGARASTPECDLGHGWGQGEARVRSAMAGSGHTTTAVALVHARLANCHREMHDPMANALFSLHFLGGFMTACSSLYPGDSGSFADKVLTNPLTTTHPGSPRPSRTTATLWPRDPTHSGHGPRWRRSRDTTRCGPTCGASSAATRAR